MLFDVVVVVAEGLVVVVVVVVPGFTGCAGVDEGVLLGVVPVGDVVGGVVVEGVVAPSLAVGVGAVTGVNVGFGRGLASTPEM